MRLQFFIQGLGGGGAERVTAETASALAARGHHVDVVVVGRLGQVDYSVDSRVSLRELNLSGESGGLVAGLQANIARLGAIRAAMRRFQPDAAIGIMLETAVLVSLAGLGLSCRTVGCERVNPPAATNSRVWRLARRLTYPLLDLVLVQTRGAAQWIRRHVLVRRVGVIPNSAQLPSGWGGGPLPDSVVRPDRHVVLGVGRLHEQKGFADLISAFVKALGDRQDWDLFLVGEGELRPELERLARESGAGDRIHLPGRTGDIAPWYSRADLFVLSSLTEGFPNVLLEAMASGTAVISTNCDFGPADIIRDGVDGCLVPVGDVDALAACVRALADDPSKRVRLGLRAAEVLARFDVSVITATWEHMLEQLCRGWPDTSSSV